MAEQFVGREEFNMYVEKISSEQAEQNRRLSVLDDAIKSIQSLALEMGKMNVTMAKMVDEQKNQGERLTAIEKTPADRWEKVVNGILSAIIAGVAGFALAHIGF